MLFRECVEFKVCRIDCEAPDRPMFLRQLQHFMLHSPQHNFFAIKNVVQFFKVRSATCIVTPFGLVPIAIAVYKRLPSAEYRSEFAQHVNESDQIAGPVDDWRSRQKVAPFASPNDLQS